MGDVKAIPDGCEHPIPRLTVKGAADALDFCRKAFGAEERCRMPGPDGRIMHAEVAIGGFPIFLNDDFPEMCGGQERQLPALGGTPTTISRYVTDVDAAIQRAADAGATVVMPAADMFWGDRYGLMADPFGHQWAFATHQTDMTPEEMAKAGARLSAAGSDLVPARRPAPAPPRPAALRAWVDE